MSTDAQAALILATFCGVVLYANIKAGSHWTGRLLSHITFWLLVGGLGLMAFVTLRAAFPGWTP